MPFLTVKAAAFAMAATISASHVGGDIVQGSGTLTTLRALFQGIGSCGDDCLASQDLRVTGAYLANGQTPGRLLRNRPAQRAAARAEPPRLPPFARPAPGRPGLRDGFPGGGRDDDQDDDTRGAELARLISLLLEAHQSDDREALQRYLAIWRQVDPDIRAMILDRIRERPLEISGPAETRLSTVGAARQAPDIAPIPIPAALPLLLGGIAALGLVARRRRKAT